MNISVVSPAGSTGSKVSQPIIQSTQGVASQSTKEANSGNSGGKDGKDFANVVKQGGSLLSKLVRVIADAIEVQPESGIATESHFERHSASGPSGTKTTYSTSFTTTTDPAKQAAFLRGTVAPSITKFADGIVNENIHLGGETVTLQELGAFVTGVEPAISPLFDLIARKFSGKGEITSTQPQAVNQETNVVKTTGELGGSEHAKSEQQSDQTATVPFSSFSLSGVDLAALKTHAANSSDEQLGATVRRILDDIVQTSSGQTPPDDGPKPAA